MTCLRIIPDTDAIRIVNLINLLTSEEGASVDIFNPNADFNGQSEEAVEVCAEWTNWRSERYSGQSLLACLEKAASLASPAIRFHAKRD